MRDDTVQATMIVPELPPSAVNKPTVLLPSARLDYRVLEIRSRRSRSHDISLKEIVNANKLTAQIGFKSTAHYSWSAQ